MNRAVFIDRDGVIIQEPPHYPHTHDQMILIPKTEDAIRLLNENDFKTIIVTNQAGVAKGYYTEDDVISFNKLMIKELKRFGVTIDAVFYCCHDQNANCDCRKPKPGMLKKAEKELNIDLKRSFIIGDKKIDIDTGKNVGSETCLVLTGHGTEEFKKYDIGYDFIAKDLYDAVKKILNI